MIIDTINSIDPMKRKLENEMSELLNKFMHDSGLNEKNPEVNITVKQVVHDADILGDGIEKYAVTISVPVNL